ncbi:calcium-binding protein 39-like isoform X1 [Cryptosporidium felis]|nr:calcium-binding protein 39-like isoform X1 [Cryptosporidium felis]
MLSWLNLQGRLGGRSSETGLSSQGIEGNREVRADEFSKFCGEVNKEIVKAINSKLCLDGEDKIERLEGRDTRNRIFERTNSGDGFVCIFSDEKKLLELRTGLESVKRVLLDLVERQEREMSGWMGDAEDSGKGKEKVREINAQICTLSKIFCEELLLNLTCVLGLASSTEHSLWVNIISLLIVFEIRSCQQISLFNGDGLDSNQDKLVMLGWLRANSDEFFSFLLRLYGLIPITYKVGEVLRDVSTLLNLSQGSGIVDKQNNRTFQISDSFRSMSTEIINDLIYRQKILLKLIELSGNQCFDVSSDSVATLRCYLFVSPQITNEYILQNQQTFFSCIFENLIQSGEYVPQRHGLRLLNQLLSLKELSKTMTVFSSSCEYLQVFMKLITSSLDSTSFEAFHIFKLFIANPNKPPGIQKVLLKNREKIIEFLIQFQPSRTDPQFISDKEVSRVSGFTHLLPDS